MCFWPHRNQPGAPDLPPMLVPKERDVPGKSAAPLGTWSSPICRVRIAEHFTELNLQGGSRAAVKGQVPPRVAPPAIVTWPSPPGLAGT